MPKPFKIEEIQEKSDIIYNKKYKILNSFIENGRTSLKIECNNCKKLFIRTYASHICSKSNCCDCINLSDVQEKSDKIHNYKYKILSIKDKMLEIECLKCGNIFFRKIKGFFTNRDFCKNCNYDKKRLSIEKIRNRCYETHGDKYFIEDQYYTNNSQPIKIYCKICQKPFQQSVSSLLSGHGCSNCSNNRKKTINDIIKLNDDKYKGLFLIPNQPIKNYNTDIKIICLKCGKEFKRRPMVHFYKNSVCPHCEGVKKSDLDIVREKSKEIHGDKYIILDQEYKKYKNLIEFYCKNCGRTFKQRANNHIHLKQGCPYCNISRGENDILIFLEKNQIIYETQKKFDNCKDKRKLPFDFYLPDLNTCIEYDGKQHYEINERFGGEEEFKNLKRRDKIKTDFCKNNNIRLMRIKYDENIEDILKNLINHNHLS